MYLTDLKNYRYFAHLDLNGRVIKRERKDKGENFRKYFFRIDVGNRKINKKGKVGTE